MTVGRLQLPESDFRDFVEKPSDVGGGRSVTFAGATVGSGPAQRDVDILQQNILGLYGDMVPVVMAQKEDWNGYYYINTVNATLTRWFGDSSKCEWSIEAELAGFENDIDLESRLGGPLTLTNTHSGLGERWHAPAPGHLAYWSGSASPSQIVRTGAEGPIVVYRDIPVGVNPRWNVPPGSIGAGRVRFVDDEGYERAGVSCHVGSTDWVVSNSLASISCTGENETFELGANFAGVWTAKRFDIRFNDEDLTIPVSVSLVRNTYEAVSVRVLWDMEPSGRVSADITLRRGSRFVEIYVKSMISGKIGIHPSVSEASTNGAGFITATSADGAGKKYTAGTPGSYTADTGAGGLSLSSTAFLDAYVGTTVSGEATDTPALMYEQFLGSPTERVIGVRL